MPWAGKGYWPGTGDLLVAFIFSFKVPKGPCVLILLIDHIAAGGGHMAQVAAAPHMCTHPSRSHWMVGLASHPARLQPGHLRYLPSLPP